MDSKLSTIPWLYVVDHEYAAVVVGAGGAGLRAAMGCAEVTMLFCSDRTHFLTATSGSQCMYVWMCVYMKGECVYHYVCMYAL